MVRASEAWWAWVVHIERLLALGVVCPGFVSFHFTLLEYLHYLYLHCWLSFISLSLSSCIVISTEDTKFLLFLSLGFWKRTRGQNVKRKMGLTFVDNDRSGGLFILGGLSLNQIRYYR